VDSLVGAETLLALASLRCRAVLLGAR